MHVHILFLAVRKTDRCLHRCWQHLTQEDDTRRARAICYNRLEHGPQSFCQCEARGDSLAGNQQTIEILHAGLEADAHLLEGAAQLTDLVFTLDAQRPIELPGGEIFRLCRQALQRPRDRAQVDTQRDQCNQTQKDDHQRDREGDVDSELLGLLGRDGEHDGPWMAGDRLVIDELPRAHRSGLVEERGLLALLPLVGRPVLRSRRVIDDHAIRDQQPGAIDPGQTIEIVDQRARVRIGVQVCASDQQVALAFNRWNGGQEGNTGRLSLHKRRNRIDLIRHALLRQSQTIFLLTCDLECRIVRVCGQHRIGLQVVQDQLAEIGYRLTVLSQDGREVGLRVRVPQTRVTGDLQREVLPRLEKERHILRGQLCGASQPVPQ